MNVPVEMALPLRAEGMAWRDIAQEIAWSTGRMFTPDGIARACDRAKRPRWKGRASESCPQPFQETAPDDFIIEGIITALLSGGLNTCEIARKTGLVEFQVYNLLSRMKEGKR